MYIKEDLNLQLIMNNHVVLINKMINDKLSLIKCQNRSLFFLLFHWGPVYNLEKSLREERERIEELILAMDKDELFFLPKVGVETKKWVDKNTLNPKTLINSSFNPSLSSNILSIQ